jgi:predicted nucleic-acid-binding Zn-ribbon protein
MVKHQTNQSAIIYCRVSDEKQKHDGDWQRTAPQPNFNAEVRLQLVGADAWEQDSAMQHRNWQCQKCGNRDFDVDQFRATGGMFAKIFDIQNRRFVTVTCSRCTYTEIYKASSSRMGDVFDFFTQ